MGYRYPHRSAFHGPTKLLLFREASLRPSITFGIPLSLIQILTLLSLEIGSHVSSLMGTTSDVIAMYYSSDIELGREQTVPLIVRSFIDPVHTNPQAVQKYSNVRTA